MVVIDPRRTETAELADFHLQVRPGTDAWCLAALVAALVEQDLLATGWLAEHAVDLDEVLAHLRAVDIDRYCEIAGVDAGLLRRAATRIGTASSVALFEDLGVQMSLHSTLSSYLDKLIWILTGNFAVPGAQYAPTSLVNLAGAGIAGAGSSRTSPVAGARIISGLVPANVIAEEILTDHPARYRAMLVESGNPAHSLADSQRMRAALSSLDLLVVIDVAMTETARLAHYVLPASSQFEKWEATFFNFDFPHNVFHLRRPFVDPLPGTLPEPEIHTRLCEALGAITDEDVKPLRDAAVDGRAAFAEAFFAAVGAKPQLGRVAPALLYRTLGPTLPDGAAAAAVLWAAAHRCAMTFPESVAKAGFADGDALFDAILGSPSGLTFTIDDHDASWTRLKTDDGKIHLAIDELLGELDSLASETPPGHDPAYPFVLSAGERRSFTANTIFRDPAWRKKDPAGSLRISPDDAASLGIETGDPVRVVSRRAVVVAPAELSEMMQPGHVSLPNGLGVDNVDDAGRSVVTGAPPNELTASDDRDWIAGTPWHKHVPVRLERVDAATAAGS